MGLKDFDNKVVLVTGAGSGIGREAALTGPGGMSPSEVPRLRYGSPLKPPPTSWVRCSSWTSE
jgi:hypothetical protein